MNPKKEHPEIGEDIAGEETVFYDSSTGVHGVKIKVEKTDGPKEDEHWKESFREVWKRPHSDRGS
jgi:hypothetical protein